ncbi:MAG TPA: 3-hydroxyacyl-CoA dehydrogenase family protein [Bacteroidales bacterium]|nr:3-hydroxyacyl-CoA dehydrogenase family protein [Bacteroidales bacterium]HSA43839.1 3-hydroxyacyl-CoA dehydrogenase family protein [Bacteroidales bacterium]
MTYEERLQNVSVLGAAGKMGSGIILLTALEMADLSLKPEHKGKTFVANAIDVSHEALAGLVKYLQTQVFKAAEKKMVQLRHFYSDRPELIENSHIVDEYVRHVLGLIRPSVRLESAYDSLLVFEAIKEDPAVKNAVLSQIDRNNPNKPWYFTNTSSIPISELDEGAGLEGRIIGFHFYNPPAIQKLVEVIKGKHTLPELGDFALKYAKNMKKITVPSNDIAGFIGNGHFMRDLLFGISLAQRLSSEMPLHEAIFTVNKVTQDYLVRPMGIFQLMDYVGLDVCRYILSVMNPRIAGGSLHAPLLEEFTAKGVKGGQHADGSQKNGILQYDKGKITGVYCLTRDGYAHHNDFEERCNQRLGAMPEGTPAWKNAVRVSDKDSLFKPHFEKMKNQDSLGARLAVEYASESARIARQLVTDGVANQVEDVNTVLLTGFFHAYGPVNEYL